MDNKFLFIFLTGFLSLNGMEEGEVSREPESNSESLLLQPSKLKTIAALNISKLILSKKLDWKILSRLPHELVQYIKLFNRANIYFFDPLRFDGSKVIIKPNSKLEALISETKELLNEVIVSGSEHTKTIIPALKELLDFSMKDKEEWYRFIDRDIPERVYAMLKIFLNLILNPSEINLRNLINEYNDICYQKPLENDEKIKDFFYCQAILGIHCDYFYIVKLLLDSDLFSNEDKINLLSFALEGCLHYPISTQMLTLLVGAIEFKEHELEYIVSKSILKAMTFRDSLNKRILLDNIRYFFELIEEFGIEIKDVINQKDPETGDTLLHLAVHLAMPDVVSFLLKIGADPFLTNKTDHLSTEYVKHPVLMSYNYGKFDIRLYENYVSVFEILTREMWSKTITKFINGDK